MGRGGLVGGLVLCVLAHACSDGPDLVHEGGALSVEAQSLARVGEIWVNCDLIWTESGVRVELSSVSFTVRDQLPLVEAARRMSGDGNPQAVRLQGVRADASRYTATLAYTHCYDDLCSWSRLDTPEAITEARNYAGHGRTVNLHVADFPMLPDTVELRVLVGRSVALRLQRPEDPSVTLAYGPPRAEHRARFNLDNRTTMIEWTAKGPRWMSAQLATAKGANFPMSAQPRFIVPLDASQTWSVDVTDGFQLVHATVELEP